eukprot:CAMPEP_0117516816 /NCGR_PEP_ID=MMETSP0784-20121206/31289_1 /TAXON_ID=39447 /ORGANISM="" /LENGTH=183 /DNA_ID=CAMNT_0005312673 /DNA_START=211 /DNA_END=762 /DNA_ORIENTATION=+
MANTSTRKAFNEKHALVDLKSFRAQSDWTYRCVIVRFVVCKKGGWFRPRAPSGCTSKNNFKLRLFEGDREMRMTDTGFQDKTTLHYWGTFDSHGWFTKVEIEIDGGDAAFVDYVVVRSGYYSYGTCKYRWSDMRKEFGRLGHKGWCLSTDNGDSYDWDDAKKCFPKFEFRHDNKNGDGVGIRN